MNEMIPFDFSSFLVPTDVAPAGNEWFSYDFYSAMRETGHEWGGAGGGFPGGPGPRAGAPAHEEAGAGGRGHR